MTARAEVITQVPLHETGLVPLVVGREIPRIKQPQALDPELLLQSLEPQVITRINVEGNPWGVVAALSPYNGDPESVHVMVIDMSRRYLPDPHRVPLDEGNAVMQTGGKIVEFLEKQPNSRSIHFGYNWSPRAYREDGGGEEKGGYQSLTTKLHFQVWNFTSDPKTAPLDSLPEGVRWAIIGDEYKKLAAELVCKPVLERHGASILDTSRIEIDSRGVRMPLTARTLSDAIKDPAFFKFLQAVDFELDVAVRDVIKATTGVDIWELDEKIRYSFEHGTNGVLPQLRESLKLLPIEERKKRIAELEERGYPKRLVHALQLLNPHFRERSEEGEGYWIRKGLAYALVFSEDLERGKVSLRVSPGIFVGDRGGVVEANGVALKRRETAGSTNEELERRRKALTQLKDFLTSGVNPL